MNGITFSGLGSGLDTQAIIKQLVALERLPLQQIEARKATQKQKLDQIGKLQNLVKELQTKAKTLAKLSDFLTFQVASSQEGVASFSATGSALPGAHSLEVLSLAALDRWAFDGVADPGAQLASADGQGVSFSVGGTLYEVTLEQSASSLESVAAAINNAAGVAVQASVVNTGTAASPSWQLVLASKQSGESARIEGLTSTLAGLSIDGTGPDQDGLAQSQNNITVGANARAVIDGLTIERESNSFSDVLPGVAITLQSVNAGTPSTFTVEADQKAIKSKLESFVETYNKVIGFINAQSTYSEDTGTGGVLFGDSLLRQVRGELQGALFGFQHRQDTTLQDVMDDTAGYSTLSMVGIRSNSDGTLRIDANVLDEKLAADLEAFADLFVDRDGFSNGGAAANTPAYYQDTTQDAGLAAIVDRVVQRMLSTSTGPGGSTLKGLFGSRESSIQDAIKGFDRQIESREFYLEQFETNLIKRFAALEKLLGGLNSQGAALNAALLGF